MNIQDFFYGVKVENLPEPLHMKDYFMSFVRTDSNFSASYKPVLLKVMITLADSEGRVKITDLVSSFKDFYLTRLQQGKTIEVPGAFMVDVARAGNSSPTHDKGLPNSLWFQYLFRRYPELLAVLAGFLLHWPLIPGTKVL